MPKHTFEGYTYQRGFGGSGVLRSPPAKDYPLGRPEATFADYKKGRQILVSLAAGLVELEIKEGDDAASTL